VTSRKDLFVAGVRDVIPALAGTLPFGVFSGVAAVAAGMPEWIAVAMSFIVFAGTAQIAALSMISGGTPLLVIFVTACIVNLRFVMYSATVAPHFAHLPLRWKLVLGYFVTDNGFALAVTRFGREPAMPHREAYFLGCALPIYVTWQVGAMIGIFLGAQIPKSWGLDIITPLVMLSIVVPLLRNVAMAGAALTAAVVVVAAAGLPFQLNLVAAALAGITAGLFIEANFG
jgi:predicted branched-subunit amino acid permease